jgi:ubiquinone/menaquinone biosynthesis C-methylase UbiE
MRKDLFESTAYYYARYRPGYPKRFFKYVVQEFKLDKGGRMLDLGCGTGQLSVPLAPYFKEVIAMDPDAAMLKEGKQIAQKAGVRNIKWVKGSSEDLKISMGKFQLVVMGRSFHWMNQKKTLAMLYKILEPGGGVVIVSERRKDTTWTPKSRWRYAALGVIKKYLGEHRRAGKGYFKVSEKHFEDFIHESPFKTFRVYKQRIRNVWDLKGIIGYFYSMSFSSKALLGKHAPAFEKDLKAAFRKAIPSEKFSENTDLEALIAKKQL